MDRQGNGMNIPLVSMQRGFVHWKFHTYLLIFSYCKTKNCTWLLSFTECASRYLLWTF